MPNSDRRTNALLQGRWPLILALVAVVTFFAGSGFLSYRNGQTVRDGIRAITHTHETILALGEILSLIKDAETGQRGFVLTGDEKYLGPYRAAVTSLDIKWHEFDTLFADPALRPRVAVLRAAVDGKMAELGETIALRRTQGFDVALAVVKTDRGKQAMETIRANVGELRRIEEQVRAERIAEVDAAYHRSVAATVATALLGTLLGIVIYLFLVRLASVRRRQLWLQVGEAGMAQAMLGELRTDELGERILTYLNDYCGAIAGAFYIVDGAQFKRSATRGVPPEGAPERFSPKDGLLADAVKGGKAIVLDPAPEGYLRFASGLGEASAEFLAISPAASGGLVMAVLELAFLKRPTADVAALLENVSEAMAIASKAAIYRAERQEFVEEMQRQSEELQAQSEELRVSNEELEEQGRTLRESQSRLEQGQAELEQTNQQLSEQADILERQRDDIARAKGAVQEKADELERASQYKSDFLANMSHELRTPLNSSLILAKLLADNRDGNLSAEQVKYAETIQSSGNDLLSLINDILDLSKIEAGHMEVRPETVYTSRLLASMRRVFEPLAHEKKITFVAEAAADVPEAFETDGMRAEQILKNLCSNAVKFTDSGGVSLRIERSGDGLAFSVKDTGIGISEDKLETVFAAFRQADGTISRKYGGTGLGLSISRELARLLGGGIDLASSAGKGSTFTLRLPSAWAGEKPKPLAPLPVVPPKPEAHRPAPKPIGDHDALPVPVMADDREHLVDGKRTILVVEDDDSFAKILYDLAHEMGFQCLIAQAAEEAFAVAKRYTPHAVILDIGLPDHSGLTVLDRLKNDMATRHIPVHVVSAEDQAQPALALGAVGYLVKPVQREELSAAIDLLSDRLSQTLRRVLVVEDDTTQREAVRALLATSGVETVGVGSAAECLEALGGSTFDCMVLDLNLPDSTGYALLETLSKEDGYSFPPVIVYTGRELSADDEQKLRRYSKSIIIKGARSPERLLDEVSLFLHQVVSDLRPDQRELIEKARGRDAALEGKRVLVVEDDVRNVYALTSLLEPQGVVVLIARNGREAVEAVDKSYEPGASPIDLVLMDVMMPEMDGLTATREIRKRPQAKRLPVIMLTAKAMKGDQQNCFEAGANDYMSKPLDVEKLLSLVRVWIPR